MRLQRIYAELFCETLEGVVVDGEPLDDTWTSFDLDSEFTLLCDDGQSFRVQGWAVEITVLDEARRAMMKYDYEKFCAAFGQRVELMQDVTP